MLESYDQLYKKALLEFGIDKDKYNLSFKYYDSEEDLLDIGTEICYSDFLNYYKHNGNKLIILIYTKEKEEKIIMSDAEEKEEGKIILKYNGMQKKMTIDELNSKREENKLKLQQRADEIYNKSLIVQENRNKLKNMKELERKYKKEKEDNLNEKLKIERENNIIKCKKEMEERKKKLKKEEQKFMKKIREIKLHLQFDNIGKEQVEYKHNENNEIGLERKYNTIQNKILEDKLAEEKINWENIKIRYNNAKNINNYYKNIVNNYNNKLINNTSIRKIINDEDKKYIKAIIDKEKNVINEESQTNKDKNKEINKDNKKEDNLEKKEEQNIQIRDE